MAASYSVKEIYYTLQGEGANTGRPAVFCRFAGCNLWSGHEDHRDDAICPFCDTDFVGTDGAGGGKFESPAQLAAAVAKVWGGAPSANESRSGKAAPERGRRLVVCTGGEPLLQLDGPAIKALQGAGFEVAIETNGTLEPPPGIDWICVSPKANAPLRLVRGHELKLVFPQEGLRPEELEHLEFDNFFLQPMDGADRDQNTRLAVEYCLSHPRWRLSVQTHKYIGID